jgi:hypothetical protein
VREGRCVREKRMMWNFVEVEILIWQALEKAKNFLSASGFNLYYRFVPFLLLLFLTRVSGLGTQKIQHWEGNKFKESQPWYLC